jgi:hypothetical protein
VVRGLLVRPKKKKNGLASVRRDKARKRRWSSEQSFQCGADILKICKVKRISQKLRDVVKRVMGAF